MLLSFYKTRLYDPTTGSFISPDSMIGGNRYAYTNNNPINFNDPSGHLCRSMANYRGLKVLSDDVCEASSDTSDGGSSEPSGGGGTSTESVNDNTNQEKNNSINNDGNNIADGNTGSGSEFDPQNQLRSALTIPFLQSSQYWSFWFNDYSNSYINLIFKLPRFTGIQGFRIFAIDHPHSPTIDYWHIHTILAPKVHIRIPDASQSISFNELIDIIMRSPFLIPIPLNIINKPPWDVQTVNG